MSQDWHHYAIYFNPSDFPGKYVLRRWAIKEGVPFPLPDPSPTYVADTLSEVRAQVPAGLVHLHRHPEDDPVIVETWM